MLRGIFVIIGLGVLFSLPPLSGLAAADDKKDDKDAVIERQRLEIEQLKALLELQRRANEKAEKRLAEKMEQFHLQWRNSFEETAKDQKRLTKSFIDLSNAFKNLGNDIKEREAEIIKLKADADAYRLAAGKNETLAKTQQARNELLLAEVQRLKALLAKLDRAKEDTRPELNPPKVRAKGKILQVNKDDKGLVEINLGTDDGVQKGNTLDVYRFHPEPKYLGAIRIIEAMPHKSVARRIMSNNPLPPAVLQEGDLVASQLLPTEPAKKK